VQRFSVNWGSVCTPCSSALLLIVCLTVRPAIADNTPPEHAEELFNEGLRLMQSDHCQDAIAYFVESQRSDPAAATLANLATCYARLGRTGSAYSTYKLAARAAILENKPELQKRTDQAASALVPSLTQLRVVPLGGFVTFAVDVQRGFGGGVGGFGGADFKGNASFSA
jgi:hypothetical protein